MIFPMAKKTSTKKSASKRSYKPIRVGVVGLGRAGWSMQCDELDRYPEMFQVVAGCDTIKLRRENFTKRYDQPAYASIGKLIADPNVEMVSIATRSCDHFAHAKAALEAGKDVFLEKPITTTYEDACKLRRIANRKSTGRLFIRHNRRFEAGFMQIRELLASGIIGEVFQIKLRRLDYQFRGDWQTLKRFGGGQLLNWGPHIIDHALQFMGGRFKKVAADLKCIAAVGDAEDHVKLGIVGPSGLLVDLEISGAAALGEPMYHIFGTKGALTAGDNYIHLKYLDPKVKLTKIAADPGTPGSEGHPPRPNHVQVQSGQHKETKDVTWVEEIRQVAPATTDIWQELFASVRRGKTFPINLDDAVEVMRVVYEAKCSSDFYRTSR
jgi:scyllo-inositol 2-dehydrogenase (NADP+)